ncbi:hypothetical protein [Nocardioides massiliensis]|uniref:N-acetyltransferase domain-containing protein n=1 Tax=Nocardioides massiliensis TaxID=1325935 RepID=A0ABT9NN82_9ACTN|nr:hypothetical protein [Nocardioides massiliensis]MDP9821776.1 hypothetical protein [Nocardioides massiliensis]
MTHVRDAGRQVNGLRVPGVHVERRTKLPEDEATVLYPHYERTFGPLRTAAAARHVLSLEEFVEDMADERIDKWVATDGEGNFLGLSILVTDLAAVPWASAEFYAARHPEHVARGAVWYLGFTMTIPGEQGGGIFATMLTAMMEAAVAEEVIVAWDMCEANVRAGLNDGIMGMLLKGAGAPSIQVDTQTYFTADFGVGAD